MQFTGILKKLYKYFKKKFKTEAVVASSPTKLFVI